MGPLPGDQGCGFIQEKEVSVLARTRDDAPGVQAADDPGFMLIKVNNLLIVVQDTAIAHESTPCACSDDFAVKSNTILFWYRRYLTF